MNENEVNKIMVELQQATRASIRPASIDDASAIAHVQVETWRSAYRGIIANEFLASRSKDDRTFRWTEILKQPEQATFVAEADGAGIVGFVNGGPGREGRSDYRGELYAIYVLPEWQRSGIGRNLTAAFARWLNESGYSTMIVWVLSLNPFRRFYEKLGGTLISTKNVVIGTQTFEEAAYGWDDVGTLTEGSQDAEASHSNQPTLTDAMPEIQIVKADLSNTHHQDSILAIMDAYSKDPMGDGKPLSEFARQHLIDGLRTHPTTLVFLALEGALPRGIATCFGGFSTFAARPLINISDFYIDPEFRGRGLGRSLLAAIERDARNKGCCKLTLEVQENNSRARSIYRRFGFAQAVYAADVMGGGSIYMVKSLT